MNVCSFNCKNICQFRSGMSLGSFVVWLLIAGGMRRGTAAGGLTLSSPPLPRWQEEKMGWSGVRLTTSLQLSTKIHGTESVHTHQSVFWVNSRVK